MSVPLYVIEAACAFRTCGVEGETVAIKRSRVVTSKHIGFSRDEAEQCRDLARIADELYRTLMRMAQDWETYAKEAEHAEAISPRGQSRPPVSESVEKFEPIMLSIKDAATQLGLDRTTIYRLIGEGRLHTVKIGNRRLIKTASIRALAENQN